MRKIDIYADGADIKKIKYFNKQKNIKGITTNPSLMKKAGVTNYLKFVKEVSKIVKTKSVSFEVFSDDIPEMYNQAKKISSFGKNIYVKIPITNTKGKSCIGLIKKLSNERINLNITAILTEDQIKNVIKALNPKSNSIVSIFSGRIADTGRDPIPFIKLALKLKNKKKRIKILWASTREIFNIIQAKNIGCNIITVPTEMLKKLDFFGYSLKKYSLDTVKTFYQDSISSGFKI